MRIYRRIGVLALVAGLGPGAGAAAPSGPPGLYVVAPRSPWTLRELQAARATLVTYDPDTGEATVLATPDERERLAAAGFALATLEPDADRGRRALAAVPDLGLYHTYDETLAALDALHARFPALTRLETIGRTGEGRAIVALKISDDPDGEDAGEPDVLLVGCHHAREFMSVELPLDTARRLLEGAAVEPRLARLVATREIWIVPLLNADGHVYQEVFQAGPDWEPPGWRKNRTANLDGTFGVDPNRNYGFQWGYDDTGSSPDGASETYRGTGPFSEAETRALRDLVQRQRFTIALSYHSYGKLLLYPWGYEPAFTDDHEVFRTLADSMVRENGYRPGNPALGTIYLTNGEFDDWLYGELTTRKPQRTFGFTVELNSALEGGFWPPDSLIAPTCAALWPLAIDALEAAANLRAPLAPPAPRLTARQDEANARIVHLTWMQPVDADNPVDHWEVFEIDPAGVASAPFEWARSAGTERVPIATAIPMPRDRRLVLRLETDLEPLWDYAYVEARGPDGVWRALGGAATTDASPTGRNRGRGITGRWFGRVATFDLSDFDAPWIDVALRVDADGRAARAARAAAWLDLGATWPERRRVVDPDVRVPQYDAVAPHAGILAYGVTAVDVHGQRADSDVFFVFVPTTAVEVGDVRLDVEDDTIVLQAHGSSAGTARFEAWSRRLAESPARDAAGEWRSGALGLRAATEVRSGEPVRLAWRAEPGPHLVVLVGRDADGPRCFGPWSVAVAGRTALHAPAPNPCNPWTRVAFTLAHPARVRLDVVRADGARVRTLRAGAVPAGQHTAVWDGRDAAGRAAASGTYFLRLQADARVFVQRVVRLR